MLFWNNDYSPGLADHVRPVRSAVRPASAECCGLGLSSNGPVESGQSGTVHRKYNGLPMRIYRNENYFALLYIVRQVTISYFALQFRWNSPVFWCFEIPCLAQGSVSRMRADLDVLGIVNIGAVIHRKYPSSDVNTIDRNIEYRSKCSSMIYGKTNVHSIAMKADRSSAMVSLNTVQTTVSLNIHKNSANKFGRKMGFKIENEFEDQVQSIPQLTGILTEVRCIFGQNLEILTSTGGEWSCVQAQNCVNFDFQVKFDLEGQGQSTPKTIKILTKMFCMSG